MRPKMKRFNYFKGILRQNEIVIDEQTGFQKFEIFTGASFSLRLMTAKGQQISQLSMPQ